MKKVTEKFYNEIEIENSLRLSTFSYKDFSLIELNGKKSAHHLVLSGSNRDFRKRWF